MSALQMTTIYSNVVTLIQSSFSRIWLTKSDLFIDLFLHEQHDERLRSPPVYVGVRVRSLVFHVVFCVISFVAWSFSFCGCHFMLELWFWVSLWYVSPLFYKSFISVHSEIIFDFSYVIVCIHLCMMIHQSLSVRQSTLRTITQIRLSTLRTITQICMTLSYQSWGTLIGTLKKKEMFVCCTITGPHIPLNEYVHGV